jgi:hypothetical protein
MPEPVTNPNHASECPVCGSYAELEFERAVLGHIRAEFYLCGNCQFIFARPADWLAEAYASALAITDTGAVWRNSTVAEFLSAFATFAGVRSAKGLDVGGGHGLLVRMLRDRGLNFRWTDEHAENLFARGFEDEGGEYDWLTLVEVFEHLVEPGAFLAELVGRRRPRCIFFTTELRPVAVPPPEWRYWSFETGQHIGFATAKSLEALGARFGYRLASRGWFHLFYREPRLKLAFVLAGSRLRSLHGLIARRFGPSLTTADHHALVNQVRSAAAGGRDDRRGP